jgi:hypothetical protein
MAGSHPLEVLYYASGSPAQLWLSWTPPNGVEAPIPSAALQATNPLLVVSSDSKGAFVIPGVPARLDSVRVRVELMDGRFAESVWRLPVNGTATDFGNVVIGANKQAIGGKMNGRHLLTTVGRFLVIAVVGSAAASAQFSSGSTGSDGALNFTTPGTINFNPAQGENKRRRRPLDPRRFGIIRHNKAQSNPAIRYILIISRCPPENSIPR